MRTFGQKLVVQFGAGARQTIEKFGDDVRPSTPAQIMNMPWRNLRILMSRVPADATVMRLSLLDNNLGPKQFIAITGPGRRGYAPCSRWWARTPRR